MATKKKAESAAIEVTAVEETVAVKTEEKKAKIIANEPGVMLRVYPTTKREDELKQMPVGTAFEITKEIENIFGKFYLVDNKWYVLKDKRSTIYR